MEGPDPVIRDSRPHIAWTDPVLLFPSLAIILFTLVAVAARRQKQKRQSSIVSLGSRINLYRYSEKTEPTSLYSFKQQEDAQSTCSTTEPEPLSTGEYGTAKLDADSGQMQLHKELYFKLQHLEQYAEILPQARDVLISLLSEALANASQAPNTGILSIGDYSRARVLEFQRKEDGKVLDEWEQYLARRNDGGRREMFRDTEEARWWLRQSAPVKFVDGAWLGHINKVTTPYALRRVVTNTWQVLSEELGDGDLEKNHVYLYRQLMKVVDPELPAGDAPDFIHPRHNLNEPSIWKAAVAQLLISLFPHELLPEILGFNMHFEAVALETLKVAKELKELRFDPYYFILHISIDNAHSGHTAMAVEAVAEYIELIKQTHGDAAAQEAWKRVQAGYVLSKGLATAPVCPALRDQPSVPSSPLLISEAVVPHFPRNPLEAEVINIFKAKAEVAHKIHCGCRIKIGGLSLAAWFEPGALASPHSQMQFLDGLSNAEPWIYKGDSKRSRFIKELSWRGKMFGSFTPTEVQTIEQWINSMGKVDAKFYWCFINQREVPAHSYFHNRDIRVDHPVIEPLPVSDLLAQTCTYPRPSSTFPPPWPASIHIDANTAPNLPRLLPLWFSHPCLLEHFICIPAQTTTVFSCAILRVLRAQYGFGPEGPIVSGMDEVRREEKVGLVDLGLQMVRRSGFPEPGSLKEVLDTWESEFGLLMLHLCKRPLEFGGLLLGIAMAFVDLHDAVAQCPTLLPARSRRLLAYIAGRERAGLNVCLESLRSSQAQWEDFVRGYYLGRAEIEKCFESQNDTSTTDLDIYPFQQVSPPS